MLARCCSCHRCHNSAVLSLRQDWRGELPLCRRRVFLELCQMETFLFPSGGMQCPWGNPSEGWICGEPVASLYRYWIGTNPLELDED